MEKTTPVDLLEHAQNKITTKILDTMENGETLILNERFELYKYFNEDYFVLKDNKYNDDTFCVQYGYKDSVVLTDFYGYDDDEDFTNLNK